jgi:hypothetical protein
MSSNWEGSTVSLQTLQDLARIGLLPKEEDGLWRAPGDKTVHAPRDGELVLFTAHIEHGLLVSGSPFFRELLNYYGLCLHDLGPNSILQVSAFTFLCEAYHHISPTLGLWLETFSWKQQTEHAGGPPLEVGAISFQRRVGVTYPKPRFMKKVAGWSQTFFYATSVAPTSQSPFLPFTTKCLVAQKDQLTSKAAPGDSLTARDAQQKISILCHCGLRFRTLVGSRVHERIVPLAPRQQLLFNYSGRLDDPLRAHNKEWTQENFISAMKKLIRDEFTDLKVSGYPPFWKGNRHFAVSHIYMLSLLVVTHYSC